MNILVVSQYYYPEPFRINEICEELVKRGHKVTVLTGNPNYPDGEIYNGYDNIDIKEVIKGVKVYRCKCRPRHKGALNLAKNYIDFVIHANRKIKKLDEEFDCIYIYQLSPITSCFPAIVYKTKKNIPIFLYCLDIWPESIKGTFLEKQPFFLLIKIISKYIYKTADKICVSTPSFIDYLSILCKKNNLDIQYIPQHANDILEIVNRLHKKDEKKEILNFLFAGNIGEVQNIEEIIYAISKVKNKKNMRFHIVGTGSCFEKCIQLTEKLGLKDIIIFHGRYPKEEMPKFYAIADVCVVSLKDVGIVGNTIPGKVQEYMSAGKCILAYTNGDTQYIINDAKCGVCVPAHDINKLTVEIEKMINAKEKIVNFGLNSRLYYLRHFTLTQHIKNLEGQLKMLIDRYKN